MIPFEAVLIAASFVASYAAGYTHGGIGAIGALLGRKKRSSRS